MTRGNFVLITNTANWMSIQFNGDMYPSCNGKFVYHMLESVETYDDLAAAILKFDGECFRRKQHRKYASNWIRPGSLFIL